MQGAYAPTHIKLLKQILHTKSTRTWGRPKAKSSKFPGKATVRGIENQVPCDPNINVKHALTCNIVEEIA